VDDNGTSDNALRANQFDELVGGGALAIALSEILKVY